MNKSGGGPYSIGIDLGTSSCKVCAVDPSGKIMGSASAGYKTYSPNPGWAEQDPLDWLDAVQLSLKALFQQIPSRQIACAVLTSAAHIGVLLDSTGRPVGRSLLWSDQRSTKEAQNLQNSEGDYIFSTTCNRVSTSWTLPHLAWIRENERESWGSVGKVCLSKDYILHALTDSWRTDPATAVSSMLYDAQKGTWSERICAMLGLSPAMLPELGEAGMVCGSIHKAASEKSGLPEGTPVILGTLDSATETYGAGAAGPGDVVIRIGTAGGIHLIQDRPSPNPLLLSYPFIKSPFWYTQAGTSSAGSAIAWAAGNIDPTGIKSNFDAFSALAAEAEPGADGLLFHPYLLGERTPYWEASLRGTFTGVGFQHGKKHFARAVLEGVAFSLCDALTSLDIELPVSKPIRVVGGGARDQLLMEVLASILQRELLPLEGTDSSYGAALFGQTIMNGDSIGPEAAIKNVRPILPRKEHLSFYAQRFVEYRTYASKLIGLYRKT